MESNNLLNLFLGLSFIDNSIQYKKVSLVAGDTFFFNKLFYIFSIKYNSSDLKFLISFDKDITNKTKITFFTTEIFKNLKLNFEFFFNKNVYITIKKIDKIDKIKYKKIIIFLYKKDELDFYVLPNISYFNSLLKFIDKDISEYNSLFIINKIFKDFFYKKISSFDININLLFQYLKNKEIQLLINTLFKEKKIDITMLKGLMYDRNLYSLIFQNLSKNLKTDIESIGDFDYLWNRQSIYLLQKAIKDIIEEEKIYIGILENINQLRNFKIIDFFRNMLKEIKNNELYNVNKKIANEIPSVILAKSLSDEHYYYFDFFYNKIESNKRKEIFKEDYFFAKNIKNYNEILKSKIYVIEFVSKKIYENKKKSDFFDEIFSLDRNSINFLIKEVGIIFFSKAFYKTKRDIKQKILKLTDFITSNILKDIFSGRIRYKEDFGDLTIEKVRKKIMEKIFFYKFIGIFN